MIETSGIGTILVIIVFGVLLPLGMIPVFAIIVMGPRRYREWEKAGQHSEERSDPDPPGKT